VCKRRRSRFTDAVILIAPLSGRKSFFFASLRLRCSLQLADLG
jgi:hypothetical protein